MSRVAQRLGASRLGVWAIKHVVAPIDRYTSTHFGRAWLGGRVAPVLLLTTRGRQSGRLRANPLIYLREGERFIVCNVNPGFERTNPWIVNLKAHPEAEVRVGNMRKEVVARIATEAEVDRYWPRLTAVWPAYQDFYTRGGERTIFVLEPRQRPGA